MNKIERAIEDTRTELKRLRNNKLCIDAKIEALEEQLESLESIERTHSIPHGNACLKVTKEEIAIKRFNDWELYNKDNFDLTNECTFTDGFSRGALWMQGLLTLNK
jgi:chromosome segregation ATPase